MPRLSIYRCSQGWARGDCAIDWRRTFEGVDCFEARAGSGVMSNVGSLIIVKAFRVEFSPSLSARTNRCCRFSANHCRPTSGCEPTASLRSWAPSWGPSLRDPERQHSPRSLRKIEQIVGRESRSRRWRTLRDEERMAIKNAKKSRNFQLRGSIGSRFHRLQSVSSFPQLQRILSILLTHFNSSDANFI